MSNFDPTSARLAITETLHRYAWSYDTRDLALMATTFTPDASFTIELAGTPGWGPFTDRAAIIAWLGAIMATQTDQRRHVVTNLIVHELTPTRAVAASYLTLTAAENGQLAVKCTGSYRDELSYTEEQWRIQRKILVLDCAF